MHTFLEFVVFFVGGTLVGLAWLSFEVAIDNLNQRLVRQREEAELAEWIKTHPGCSIEWRNEGR